MNPTRDLRTVFVVTLALVALTVKLAIAFNTIGTNDTVVFYGFAKVLSQHSLGWTYAHSRYFNHPPLTAYFLRGIFALTEQQWCQGLGIHFPFLLRLPGILADFGVVLILLRLAKDRVRVPTWALALLAVSPASLMVSGFHGNTDAVLVLFLVCSVWMCLRNQPVAAGFFFALSCQIKIVPLLLLPGFVMFWWSQHRSRPFIVAGAVTTAVFWAEPLLGFPVLFAKNVFGYGGYWGLWGVTYLIRLTGLRQFSRVSCFDLEPDQVVIMSVLKVIVIAGCVWLAWRNRQARGQAFVESIGCAWLIFFLLTPSISPQYLVWATPFILVLSPPLHAAFLLTSSIFLFAFYNITSGGLPWNLALAMDDSRQHWGVWSLIPWFTLIVGSIVLWLQKQPWKSRLFFPNWPAPPSAERRC